NSRLGRNMFKNLWRSTYTFQRLDHPDNIRQNHVTHIKKLVASSLNSQDIGNDPVIAASNGSFWFSCVDDAGLFRNAMIGVPGLAFLMAEGAVLSAHGTERVAALLAAILVASTISSIAGFAFSALCGAFLFHLVDSPVHAVNVMIVCSIAIQL